MYRLKEIKANYAKGFITKAKFIEQMHEIHEKLFEYSDFLKETDIKKIDIMDGKVVMTARSSDIKMICDKDDQRIAPIEILNFGHYEGDDAEIVFKLIKDGFTVFDIGANFGWYSLDTAKRFPNCKIYSFEPVLKTFNYLAANVKLNNFENISIYNFGLSDEEKEITFYYYPEGSGNASLANLSETSGVEEIKSLVKKMDSFIQENNVEVDFIKCDVEGAELLVFKGGVDTIKQFKPIIFTEMLRKWSKKFNYHPNEIIKLLSDLGYGCFVAKENLLKRISEIDEQTEETNFFFLHLEKHLKEIKKFS